LRVLLLGTLAAGAWPAAPRRGRGRDPRANPRSRARLPAALVGGALAAAPFGACHPRPTAVPAPPRPEVVAPTCACRGAAASTPQWLCLRAAEGAAWSVDLNREDGPVIGHCDAEGHVVERTTLQNLKAEYPSVLEPGALVFDFDGDGSSELWVRSGAALNGRSLLVSFRDGRIEDYPTPEGSFDELRDLDGDGRPDGLSYRTYRSLRGCSEPDSEFTVRTVARSLPDGTFSPAAPTPAPYARGACSPATDQPLFPDAIAELDPRRVYCARVLGASSNAVITELVRECRARQGEGCGGICTKWDLSLRITQDRTLGPGDDRAEARPGSANEPEPSSPPERPGRLDPEVIQQVVRGAYGRFRTCYESGLHGGPNLEGRVALRFVVDADGRVTRVDASESDLPDREVVYCVERQTFHLVFPPPVGGELTVVYPIQFSPG
jgi:hypothetical protein